MYAILRTAKLKTFGNIAASASHNFRERETLNADPERTHLNTHNGAENTAELLAKIKNRLPEKVRKDGVLCIEYLLTASPEWWRTASEKNQNKFFEKSRAWLIEKHGVENVIYTGTQQDELTPHMVAYVVPIDERGKLNCKAFLGGRQKLSEMQTSFASQMEPIGLERGIKGSVATHEQVKRHYEAVNRVPERFMGLSVPEPELLQSKSAYKQEVEKVARNWMDKELKPKITQWFSMAVELQNKRSAFTAKEYMLSSVSKRDAKVTEREQAFKEIEPKLQSKKYELMDLNNSIHEAKSQLDVLNPESQLKIAIRQIERLKSHLEEMTTSRDREMGYRIEANERAAALESDLNRFNSTPDLNNDHTPMGGFDFER